MPEDQRRLRMLQVYAAEEVPIPLSNIAMSGPILDVPTVLRVYACVYAELPTYEVFQTNTSAGVVDTTALRREIAGSRLPDHVNLNYTPDQETRGIRRAASVSAHLDVPIGFYAKGHYANRQRTPVALMYYMGFLPAPVFLRMLKHAATG